MIRIILFKMDSMHPDWTEGVLHTFQNGHAVVENMDNGQLFWVPVNPKQLQFKILTKDWLAMQMTMQREAQARSVQAGPPPLAR